MSDLSYIQRTDEVKIVGQDSTGAQRNQVGADALGNMFVSGIAQQTAESTAAWTSATVLNSAVTVTVTGYSTIVVTLNQGATITGGVVTFEVSDTVAFTNAYPIIGVRKDTFGTGSTYTLVASTNQSWVFNVAGWAAFRVRLSTVIAGTATVNVGVAASAGPPEVPGSISLGTSTGKTVVMKTGSLTTTATTADQVVLTYTVTAGKTFFLEYFNFVGRRTTLPGNNNPQLLGTISLELPSGTKVYTFDYISNQNYPSIAAAEPLPVAGGTVIRVVVTPADATSDLWQANFGGYEK